MPTLRFQGVGCSISYWQPTPFVCSHPVMTSCLHVHTTLKRNHYACGVKSCLRAGFGWESCTKGGWWNHLAGYADQVAEAGFTHIWMPPACQSVSREGYLPSQLYNFNSKYGSADDLKRCISVYNDAGLQPVADCVFNHRCGDRQNKKGEWLHFSCAVFPCSPIPKHSVTCTTACCLCCENEHPIDQR